MVPEKRDAKLDRGERPTWVAALGLVDHLDDVGTDALRDIREFGDRGWCESGGIATKDRRRAAWGAILIHDSRFTIHDSFAVTSGSNWQPLAASVRGTVTNWFAQFAN
jgi:hypothetical protein